MIALVSQISLATLRVAGGAVVVLRQHLPILDAENQPKPVHAAILEVLSRNGADTDDRNDCRGDVEDIGDPPSVVAYHFASGVQQTGVPVGTVTLGAENPPLTWVSYEGMQKAAGFEAERDDLNLAYPNIKVRKRAVVAYIETVQQYNRKVAALLETGQQIPTELADRAPASPRPTTTNGPAAPRPRHTPTTFASVH